MIAPEWTDFERSQAVNTTHIKRLVLAPHGDDETLGCGGILAKYPNETAVVVASTMDRERESEFLKAKEILGYTDYTCLGFQDGFLDHDMHKLVGRLDQMILHYQPHTLYLPFPSAHQDHIAMYEAGVRAGRLSMTPGHHFTPNIYAYDVAAYDLTLYPTDLKWNVFEALTEEQVDAKVQALQAYASQMVAGPHPSNSIKVQAAATGNARAVDWAEPFALVRAVCP